MAAGKIAAAAALLLVLAAALATLALEADRASSCGGPPLGAIATEPASCQPGGPR